MLFGEVWRCAFTEGSSHQCVLAACKNHRGEAVQDRRSSSRYVKAYSSRSCRVLRSCGNRWIDVFAIGAMVCYKDVMVACIAVVTCRKPVM